MEHWLHLQKSVPLLYVSFSGIQKHTNYCNMVGHGNVFGQRERDETKWTLTGKILISINYYYYLIIIIHIIIYLTNK